MMGHGMTGGGGITLDMSSTKLNSNIAPYNIDSLDFSNFNSNAIIDIKHCYSGLTSTTSLPGQKPWGNFAKSLQGVSSLRTIGDTKGLSFRGADMKFLSGPGAIPPSSGPIYLVPNPNSKAVNYGF